MSSNISSLILQKNSADNGWIKSDEALAAIEAYLDAAERRMAIHPLSVNIISYLEVLELIMKCDFEGTKVPRCKQAHSLALRVGRLWTLLAELDSTTTALTRKAIFNSIMTIMLQDLALLAPIIDDIVDMLKGMLLIEEFQGHPSASRGCPRLAIFRSVQNYVRLTSTADAALSRENEFEVRLPTPAHLSRCQGLTAGLLAQILRLDDSVWTMRCLGYHSTIALWKVICAQIVSRNATTQVRIHALKLISNQLLSHAASTHMFQRGLLSVLQLSEKLLMEATEVCTEMSMVNELQKTIRRLVVAAESSAGFLASIHMIYKMLVRVILCFPLRMETTDGLAQLRRTILWCLQVLMSMAPSSDFHGYAALKSLWTSYQFSNEIACCHAVMFFSKSDIYEPKRQFSNMPYTSHKNSKVRSYSFIYPLLWRPLFTCALVDQRIQKNGHNYFAGAELGISVNIKAAAVLP